MPSEESIRTDASTVHRTGDPIAEANSIPQPPAEVPPGEVASGAGDEKGIGGDEKGIGPDGGGGALSRTEIYSGGIVDDEQLAQAKTVIRGSSRIDKQRPRLELPNRTPAAVAQVLLGQRLNHFLLEELIGGGGMGAVFRAHDEQLDRTVAIKVIPFVGDDPDLQRRFRNEAQSAAKLDHPRIARVFDVGSYDDWHYIVFEYIEGTNIRDLVNRNGVMSIDEAVFYTSQLAGALQHAADRGIVHRDIKPSNVLIGEAGKIKLVDMGLARSDNIDLSEDMTASGVTLGTFDYISPEQAQDPRVADLRSDIYSLGCTLYFMLTGQPPYPGGTMLQKLLSHGNAPPPDPRELRPQVSDNLVAVIRKMLAKNPADRYQSATDLIADLREVAFRDGLARSQSLSPITIAQPNPLFSWLEKHSPWIGAALLLIASTGWLQLESAASREDVPVSPTARRPELSRVLPPSDGGPATLPDRAMERNPLPTQPADPADSDAIGVLEPGAAALAPPGQPPEFAELRAPAELTESTAMTQREPFPGEMNEQEDGTFTLRVPFFAGEEDVSVEPLESMSPSVVRLIESRLEAGYQRDSDGAALATSLSRALELAAEYDARLIEIAVPVVYSSAPVKVEVDDLLITSTVGGGSMIVFQPADSVAMERSKMFSIGSHQIEFNDLHFVWDLPSGDVDGGALFEVNDNQLVRLTDCSITVNNPMLRDEVYAFDVITDPDKLPSFRRDEVDEFPLVSLELNNVLVRGQMTMLHMDYAAQLQLDWDNGLLAVTESMIDTAGARRDPPATAQPLLVSLTRVTAHAPKGIVSMRLGVSGAYPVKIDRVARKSVFFVDPVVPHFDISGLRSIDEKYPLLQLRGASNAYVVEPSLTDPMLRLASSDGETAVTQMNDLLTSTPTWTDETNQRWSLNWDLDRAATGLPTPPANQRKPADYRQNDVSPPGFDEKSLPSIPDRIRGDNDVSSVRSARRNAGIREEL